MGRPKGFVREEVLTKTMELFWRKGFADTSVQDLEKATGVNKSGLYSEFKGKDDLFLASLKFYSENSGMEAMLSKEPLGWKNIETFLKTNPDCSREKGCFIVNSIREMATLSAAAKSVICQQREDTKKLLLKNVKAEKPKADPQTLVSMILTFGSGLSLEQNLNDNDSTAARVDQFLALLKKS